MNTEFEKIIPWNGQNDTGKDVRLKWERNFNRIRVNFNEVEEKFITIDEFLEFIAEELENRLRKDRPDQTEFLLKLLGGGQFGKFIPGMTGSGGSFDKYGHLEGESAFFRRFIETPEFRYNRIEIVVGDKWRAPGGGLIESVDTLTQIVTLKLEDGEIGTVKAGDICMGIFHSLNSSENATETTDDSRGNRTFAGFFTAYFTITAVYGDNNNQFKYQLREQSERWRHSFHPAAAMNFVSYGSFTNPDRQSSVYETRTYTRMLWKQNTWEIAAHNIAYQNGDLGNMNVHGKNLTGYSSYQDSVYIIGSVFQIKPDGSTAPIPNFLPNWMPKDKVNFYDEVSYKGGRWLCIAEAGTNTIPDKDNPAWMQTVSPGADGESVSSAPAWRSADLPYPAKTILSFAEKLWISKRETSEAPYPLHQDANGNYILQTQDNGTTYHYIVYEETQSEDWDLLLDPKSFLKGVADTDVLYAISNSKTVAPTTGWQTLAPEWEEGKFIWSKTKTTYTDGTSTETVPLCLPTGPSGTNGTDGIGLKSIVEQYYLSTSPTVLNGGAWSNTRPEWKENRYYWTRSVITFTNNETTTTTAICVSGEKGRDGDSVTAQGDWKTGLNVKYLGTVRMGKATWVCKNPAGTTNPPLWVHTDASGNRILQTQDGGKTWGYTLTGEINTDEYDLVAEDGSDGVNGGETKQVFRTAETRPATPTGSTIPPSGWSNTPTDPSETAYMWMSQATVNGYGEVSAWSTPVRQSGLAGGKGDDGLQGCIMRKLKWKTGAEFRNDEALTGGTRYLDVALIRDDSLATGWQAYKCLKTHMSTTANAPGNTEYWQVFGANFSSVISDIIIAKNGEIELLQGSQILMTDPVTGSVIGGMSGDGYMWMGGPSPNNAANVFRKDGSGHTANSNISWDEAGHPTVKGDFIGKITTKVNGKKIVLDPANCSFTLYNSSNQDLINLHFMNDDILAGLTVKDYSGNLMIRRTDYCGSNIYMISYPEGNSTGKTLTMSLTAGGLEFRENGTLTKSYPRK